MQAYQAKLADLEATDTQVLGVSMDSTFANKAFAEKAQHHRRRTTCNEPELFSHGERLSFHIRIGFRRPP